MKLPDHVCNLSVDETLRKLLTDHFLPLKSQSLPVGDCLNLITAENITAKRDIPRFDNSAMDGFLFLRSDLTGGTRSFQISGEIRPEDDLPAPPGPGTAARIMTGAPVPSETDCIVVPVEETSESDGSVTIQAVPERNPIRKRGEGYRKGTTVLKKGRLIRPYEIGLLIESGNRECTVQKPLRVSIQVTGTEIDNDMDSNGPVLEALASSWPGTVIKRWPVLEDDPEKVTQRMTELREESDLVLTTGGISAGRHDYLLRSMNELGAEVLVRKVKQKPGKPFTVTSFGGVPFFHLPGNPISAVFTAEYYAKRAVYHHFGLKSAGLRAIAAHTIQNHRPGKTLFLTGELVYDDQSRLTVGTEKKMRSHLMQLYDGNNAYVRVEPQTTIEAGEQVEVTPF
jgi:molybdopterin molybdotransferase